MLAYHVPVILVSTCLNPQVKSLARQPLKVYPVLVGTYDTGGGVKEPPYVQLCDVDGTFCISLSSLYQCNCIVFACQSAVKFVVPEYLCNGAYLQSAVDALDDISVANNGVEIKREIIKQIVPICFIAFNTLLVCVCVCV